MKVCSRWVRLEVSWVDFECFYALLWRSTLLLNGSWLLLTFFYTFFEPFWSYLGRVGFEKKTRFSPTRSFFFGGDKAGRRRRPTEYFAFLNATVLGKKTKKKPLREKNICWGKKQIIQKNMFFPNPVSGAVWGHKRGILGPKMEPS